MKTLKIIHSFAMLLLLSAAICRAEENLTVLPGTPEENGAMMKAWLHERAMAALDARKTAFEELKTEEELAHWQEERKAFFIKQLGGFPERTPLNARVTGTRDLDGYRIEKIIIESQPGLHVTGNLYLPEGEGPFPAVIHPTGHSANGKARDVYQQANIVMARGGCAVLCYDPVGQGERRQFFDENGEKPAFATTQEHSLMNQGLILMGSNTARIMIWDGMRVIDYLQSRPDIDPEKIGCTGISGGGTNTSYLMALEERIGPAAPGCYLTGFRSLLNALGPQDSEQNIHGQIAFGMDHADYVLMRAPKPTLIMAATRDYFPIEGAWDLFRQAKRFYTRQGFPERVDLVEPDEEHGFSAPMRLAARNWMREWFGIATPIVEPASSAPDQASPPFLPDEELFATPDGQVLKLDGARSAIDLTRAWAADFANQRAENWTPANREKSLETVRELIGAGKPADLPEPKIEDAGKVNREDRDYTIAKLVIESEPGIPLPALEFRPAGNPAGAILYLHGDGKHVDARPAGTIESLVLEGNTVLAVDLRGIGETWGEATKKSFSHLLGHDWSETAVAMLLNESYVGLRVKDIWQCARYLEKAAPGMKPRIIATGEPAIPALHALALEPDLFSGLTMRESISSWQEVLDAPLPLGMQSNLVFGALRHYDLPPLAEGLPVTEEAVLALDGPLAP